MKGRGYHRLVLPFLLGGMLAARAPAGVEPCHPEVQEARARWDAAQAAWEQARDRYLLELRGSYFYYPNANLTEEDLTDTRQRADVYLRYPLLQRFRHRRSELALLESRAAEARLTYNEALRRGQGGVAEAEGRRARADARLRALDEIVPVVAAERARLERLWQSKLVLLEEVLGQEERLMELELDRTRARNDRRAALVELRELICDESWEPAPVDFKPVIFPHRSETERPSASARWRERARRERLRADQGTRRTRFDLEAGYTWEDDASDGLEGGSRFGFRFVLPFDEVLGPHNGSHRNMEQVWLARAREAERTEQRRVDALWGELDALLARRAVLVSRERLQKEQARVARVVGGGAPVRPEVQFLEEWELYFDAQRIRRLLLPGGSAVPAEEAYAVIDPPPWGTGPEVRKVPPRGVYVWGDDRSPAGDRDLPEFAESKGIVRLLISPANRPLDPFDPELTQFLSQIDDGGRTTFVLLGENGWARPGNTAGLEARLEEVELFQAVAPLPVHGIHLDIEPHALPEWDRESEKLLHGFVAAVACAREMIDRWQQPPPLEIAVPLWLGTRLGRQRLESVAGDVDRVALMAYGRPALERVQGAVADWSPLVPVILALRAEDFSSEGELEREVDTLAKSGVDPEMILVHDLTAWRRLARGITVEE